MSPIDPQSLENGTPRTTDGRTYPEHLKAYERFDSIFLPLLGDEEFTPTVLAGRVPDGGARSVLPRWLASAEWRGLIQRRGASMRSRRAYTVTDRGRTPAAAA